ncbi:hypothetical protein [Frankia sp. Cas4]|uniref:hypothetical protein n=1 Tax=Frankia sp. Cas4 TaxID=3073927 RepID=UPI002AD525AD|nr:hypothetical protein [Frankia sp. Cas4]
MAGPRRFRALSLAALSVLVPLAGAALALPARAAPSGPPRTPDCAWRVEASPQTVNAGLLDSDAVYWVMPFAVQKDLNIVLSGTYADARYTSLTVYDSSFAPFTTSNGVSSELTDYHIAPDAGSLNPWQVPASPGGHFTVTLRPDAAPGQTNVLPLAPEGTPAGRAGYLIYRVYLPTGGDQAVSLPGVAFEQDGTTVNVPLCAPGSQVGATPDMVAGMSAAATTSGDLQFARGTSSNGSLFPNPDNAYLEASVTPPGGDNVVVVRAKAPTTPGGEHPAPWPSAANLRYWSLCADLPTPPLPVVVNTLPDGTVDYGCRADEATALDSTGYYTFVVGTEAQRAAVDGIPGATFIPFSTDNPTTPHVLLLRNLLGNFPYAVQNVPPDNNPASAAAVMGSYYPQAAVCPLSTLQAGGPAACLS